jgi:hypothetical protein
METKMELRSVPLLELEKGEISVGAEGEKVFL